MMRIERNTKLKNDNSAAVWTNWSPSHVGIRKSENRPETIYKNINITKAICKSLANMIPIEVERPENRNKFKLITFFKILYKLFQLNLINP